MSHADTSWLLEQTLSTLFSWEVLARWIYDFFKKWSLYQSLSSTCHCTICPSCSTHMEDSASPTACMCDGQVGHQEILVEWWHNWVIQPKGSSRNPYIRGKGDAPICHWWGWAKKVKIHSHNLKLNPLLTLIGYLQRYVINLFFIYKIKFTFYKSICNGKTSLIPFITIRTMVILIFQTN